MSPCFFSLGSCSDIIMYSNTMKSIKTASNCVCQVRLAFLHCVYQRLLVGCVLLHQPQCMLGNFTWKELCDVINEQVDQLKSDLKNAKEKASVFSSVGTGHTDPVWAKAQSCCGQTNIYNNVWCDFMFELGCNFDV